MRERIGGLRDHHRVALALFAVSFGANQFAPLILVYIAEAGLPEKSVTAMFSVYVAGLVPALLACGVYSDRVGRRAVVRPVMVVSVLATVLMMSGDAHPAPLFLGRFLAGAASGAIFVAGSSWVHELSATDGPGSGARRAATALSAGFGGGALVAGAIAQITPSFVLPYVPHLLIGCLATLLVWTVPDGAVRSTETVRRRLVPPVARRASFVWGVAIWAPLAFTFSSVAFISLPALVAPDAFGIPYLFAGAITAATLFTGVAVQTYARRVAATPTGRRLPVIGLTMGSIGMVCASALTSVSDANLAAALLVPVVLILGAGYGILLTAGLVEIELQAKPDEYGRLVAVFYTLVYTGLAAPYLLSALSDHGGSAVWLLVAAGTAVMSIFPTVLAGRSGGP